MNTLNKMGLVSLIIVCAFMIIFFIEPTALNEDISMGTFSIGIILSSIAAVFPDITQ